MKNIKYLIILLSILFGAKFSTAQNLSTQNLDEFYIMNFYNSLIGSSSSDKTTNTVKKIKALSVYLRGNIQDSLLVLQATNFGYTKLLPTGYYFSPTSPPYINQYKGYDIFEFFYTDYYLAVHYFDDFSIADTLKRTYNSNNELTSSYLNYRPSGTSGFLKQNYQYSYDAQGRYSSVAIDFIDTSGFFQDIHGVTNITYSSNNDYIVSKFTGTRGGQSSNSTDSAVIQGGFITELYYIDNGSINSTLRFTYDTLNLIRRTETYNVNNDLIKLTDVWKISGTDNLDSLQSLYISATDTLISRYKYTYDPVTSYLTRFTSETINSGNSSVTTVEIYTDQDGDILKEDWFSNGSSYRIRNYYYEDFPASVEEAGTFDADIQAYPVPSSNEVKINSSELFDGYALYDISGRLLQSSSFGKTLESRVDLSSYSSGVYFLEIFSNGKKSTVPLERE